MDDPIRWDDDPSFPANLPVQVHSPKSGGNSFLRLLGPHAGAFVHSYREGRRRRSICCVKVNCPHCKHEDPPWKAYYPALLWRRQAAPHWLHVVAEVTSAAFEDLKKELNPQEARGKVIEVYRGPTNSRMMARLVEKPDADLGHLPAAFDVRIVLRRLWGLAKPVSREEGVFDPTPPPPLDPVPDPIIVERPLEVPDRAAIKRLLAEGRAKMNGGAK